MKPTEVVVQTTARPEYPERPPFHPDRAYPEHRGAPVGDEPNLVFDAVRSCFRRAGLDAARYGTPAWNPLGGLIRPGETVLLKPNMVNARHPRDPDGWRYTVTHGSVIRAVADYVWIALSGRGTVIVADAPETYASFEEIVSRIGLAGKVEGPYLQGGGQTVQYIDRPLAAERLLQHVFRICNAAFGNVFVGETNFMKLRQDRFFFGAVYFTDIGDLQRQLFDLFIPKMLEHLRGDFRTEGNEKNRRFLPPGQRHMLLNFCQLHDTPI